MAIEKVREYFRQFSMEDKIIELPQSSATVELAAEALHCELQRIAKTLSFHVSDRVVLIVAAGDAKIDNQKYKQYFGEKARMLDFNEAENLTGHAVGGVCPFAVKEGIEVYLDKSLKRFESVYPAAGSANSAILLTLYELEKYSKCSDWIDVCKGWNP